MSDKTQQVLLLCIMVVVISIIFGLTKADCRSCSACDSTPSPCKEQFFESRLEKDRYSDKHSCMPGARAEIVTSPPAAHSGILCRCMVGGQDTVVPLPSVSNENLLNK